MEKIAVKKLTAQIEQKTILQDISFEVEAGQSLLIIGESGSGKTLLTKILIGAAASILEHARRSSLWHYDFGAKFSQSLAAAARQSSGLYVSKSYGYVQSLSDHSKSLLGDPAQP